MGDQGRGELLDLEILGLHDWDIKGLQLVKALSSRGMTAILHDIEKGRMKRVVGQCQGKVAMLKNSCSFAAQRTYTKMESTGQVQ